MSASTPQQPSPKTEALSTEQARALVDDLIAKGHKLFVDQADKGTTLPDQIGPTTKEFFSRYGSLRARRGGFRLAAADVRPSQYVHGYLSLGHSEDWDVVQMPGSDEVFVVEGSETCEADMQVRFSSVYHLIIDETDRA